MRPHPPSHIFHPSARVAAFKLASPEDPGTGHALHLVHTSIFPARTSAISPSHLRLCPGAEHSRTQPTNSPRVLSSFPLHLLRPHLQSPPLVDFHRAAPRLPLPRNPASEQSSRHPHTRSCTIASITCEKARRLRPPPP